MAVAARKWLLPSHISRLTRSGRYISIKLFRFFPNSSLLVSLGVASCRQPVSRRCVPRTGSVPATCMTERRNVIIYSASCTWRKLHASAPTRQRAWLPTPKVSVPHACTCCICMSIGGSGPARLAADAGEEAKFASATACRLLRRTSMDPVAWQLSLLKKKFKSRLRDDAD